MPGVSCVLSGWGLFRASRALGAVCFRAVPASPSLYQPCFLETLIQPWSFLSHHLVSFVFSILCSNSGTVMWYSLLRIHPNRRLTTPQWLVMAEHGGLGRNEIMPISVCLLSPSPTVPLWLVSPVFMSFKLIFYMLLSGYIFWYLVK